MQNRPLSAQAIGGPTILLEYGGLRLVTDPCFDPPGEYRRDPHEPIRKTAGPALAPDAIGAIDAVLLSHDHHGDNLDNQGRRVLAQAATAITTAAGAERLGGNARGLKPWESLELRRPDGGAITVTAVPAQHGPDGTDHLTGPVIGFALHGDGLRPLYISGDNASLRVVEQIVDRLGSFAIAVLHLGGARVDPIDDHVTMTAEDAPAAARLLGAHAVLPVHFDGWSHYTEGFAEIRRAFTDAGLAQWLRATLPGTTLDLAGAGALKIAVLGASGRLGGEIAREAVARGHVVTALGRDADRLSTVGAQSVATVDVTDARSLHDAIAGHDVVVTSITDRSSADRAIIPRTTGLLLELAPGAGVGRLAFVGGGGSLMTDDGRRFVDLPDFPAEHRPEALAQASSLELLRTAADGIDWTYLSPPPRLLERASKRGGYGARAGDRPVLDASGRSRVSAGDLAAAMLDELEQPRFSRRRFTVGYA